jgi:hypothetical protein
MLGTSWRRVSRRRQGHSCRKRRATSKVAPPQASRLAAADKRCAVAGAARNMSWLRMRVTSRLWCASRLHNRHHGIKYVMSPSHLHYFGAAHMRCGCACGWPAGSGGRPACATPYTSASRNIPSYCLHRSQHIPGGTLHDFDVSGSHRLQSKMFCSSYPS